MKKTVLRILVLLFVLAMSFSVFMSCSGSNDTSDSQDSAYTPEEKPTNNPTDTDNPSAEKNTGSSVNNNTEDSGKKPTENIVPSVGLAFKSNGNGTCSVSGMGSCKDKQIVIPSVSPDGDKVTGITSAAFWGCSEVISVMVPDSIKSIGDKAFEYCYKLIEVINMSSLKIEVGSENYGHIGYYAKEIHSEESKIVSRNDYLFYTHNQKNYMLGYVGTDIELVLPESYNGQKYEIYRCAFQGEGIISAIIPDCVTSIGDYAFCNCTNLKSVVIPDSVTDIGNWAFHGCSNLET